MISELAFVGYDEDLQRELIDKSRAPKVENDEKPLKRELDAGDDAGTISARVAKRRKTRR